MVNIIIIAIIIAYCIWVCKKYIFTKDCDGSCVGCAGCSSKSDTLTLQQRYYRDHPKN